MMNRRQAGILKPVMWIMASFSLITLALLALLTTSIGTRWQQYAASLRAHGQPLTFAEIEEQRTVIPDAQNGALVVERSMADLGDIKATSRYQYVLRMGTKARELGLFEGVPRYVVEPTRDFVDSHRPLLTKMADLDQRKYGRFLLEYDPVNPMSTLLPHLTIIRQATDLEFAAAAVALWDGDRAGALDHIRRVFHLAGTLYEEPTLVSHSVRLATIAAGIELMEALLRSVVLTEPELRELDNLLEDELTTNGLRWALVGERALFIQICDSLATQKQTPGGLSAFTSKPLPVLFSLSYFVRNNQLTGAKLYTELIEVSHDFDKLVLASRNGIVKAQKLSMLDTLARMFYPVVDGIVDRDGESKCRIEAARCGVAIERYRLRTGEFPESLDRLVPDYLESVPRDLLGGGSLLFKSDGELVTIYSRGANRADDGGNVQPHFHYWRVADADVGIRLLPPDKRGVVILDIPPPEDE